MPSFSKMAVWPVGYFRGTTSWLLRHRRSIASRLSVINAEIARIGFVTVVYSAEQRPDGSIYTSENRVGFSVTENSSLERLIRAYIANGGNPLDISMFLHPDRTQIVSVDEAGNAVYANEYPHGGVLAPKSAEYNNPVGDPQDTGFGAYQGGYPEMGRYYPFRQGGRLHPSSTDTETVVQTMHHIRAWANQDIKELLQDMEWRILKLCDLREQLEQERDDVLKAAFGGALSVMDTFDKEEFVSDLRVQNLIQDMNGLLFRTSEGTEESTQAVGTVRSYRSHTETVGLLEFTFEDLASELLLELS